MTQKEIKNIVAQIANKFQRCGDRQAKWRAGEAVLHLILACGNNAKLYNAIVFMIDGFYDCYLYGEGHKGLYNSYIKDYEGKDYADFLVKYCRKIAFGLCAEDASVIEGYITEITAYRKEHAA